MALHGCMRCLKYIVFSFNFIVWLSGMGLLGLAVWLRMDPKVAHIVRAGYANDVNVYYIICYFLMGAGGLMTFVGFLGCCGAFQESKCMLATFFILLFLLFVAEIGIGVWAYVHRHEIEQKGKETFRSILTNNYGTRTLNEEAVDYVQRKLECCGVDDPGDWKDSLWADMNKQKQGSSRVPDSCCKNLPTRKGARLGTCGVGGEWKKNTHPGVWPEGCAHKLIDYLKSHLIIMFGVAIGIGAVELLGMGFSLLLCCAMRRSRGGGYKR